MASGYEGQVEFRYAHVEGERRERDEYIFLARVENVGHRRQKVDCGTMRNLYAFGPTSRAGCEDHVNQVVGRGCATHVGGTLTRPQRAITIQAQHLTTSRRKRAEQRFLRQEHRRLRILQHVSNAIGGIAGVNRNIRRAGLLHGEKCDHHLQRAFQVDSH